MSDTFVGEIRMFAGNFAPRSNALCDGQLMAVSQNDALFSLLGTIYGGDGRSTFGLPDLRGRVPTHWGNGPGLTPRRIGQRSGRENVTLTKNELPQHNHGPVKGTDSTAAARSPENAIFAETVGANVFRNDELNVTMSPSSVNALGGSQQHTNLQPFQCVNFIIALYGVYPSRS